MAKVKYSRKRMGRRKTVKMMGGEGGASGWAQQVYGGPGQQHAVGGNDHTIAMNKGGAKGKGGSVVADIAIPAAMIYARDSIRKRRALGLPRMTMRKGGSYKRTSRKSRR